MMYDAAESATRPDLQILVSRDLGAGAAAVCDAPVKARHSGVGCGASPPSVPPLTFTDGGIPGIDPASFDSGSQPVADALHDFGCRMSYFEIDAPCTLNDLGNPSFAAHDSEGQFCSASVWSLFDRFPSGDTRVTARWRDDAGVLGPPVSMIVRVGDIGDYPTPGPSRTPFPTWTHTPAPTPTAGAAETFTSAPTVTSSPSFIATGTPAAAFTLTPSNTPTDTVTATITPTTTPTATPTVTPTPTSACTCPGDANRNLFVNFADYGTVALNFGSAPDPFTGIGDANCNAFVNFADYGSVAANFGQACPTSTPSPSPPLP